MTERATLSRPWAIAVLTLAMAIAAANPVVGRAVIADIPPGALTFWRFVAAVVVMLPFAALPLWRERGKYAGQWWRIAAMGAFGIAVYNGFLYLGVQTTTAINASLIITTAPVAVVALTAIVHREGVGLRLFAGLVIGFLGVVVTVARGDIDVLRQLALVPGDLMMLIATAGFVFYSMLLRDIPKGLNPLGLMLAINLVTLVALAPFYAWELSRGVHFEPTLPTVGAILYVGVMATAVSFTMYNWAVGAIGVRTATQFVYLTPIFSALMAVAFLGEAFRGYHAAGILLIFGGIALATWRSSAREAM